MLEVIEPVVTGMGYELVGVEFDGRQRVLRVYIDRPTGITLDDCSRVSYQLSGALDVENPIPGRYQLEISSPGLDRPLLALSHYRRFAGELANFKFTRPIAGQRRLKARLMGVEGDCVLAQSGDTVLKIPYEAIEKARLAPDFANLSRKESRHGE